MPSRAPDPTWRGEVPDAVPRERITACLIVQDEQEHLPAALDSVAFCDEVVVVDGGSADGTVEIARAAGAKVIENPWPGYAIQRNVALDAATSEWVIEVDADERVSPQLRASIERLLAAPPSGVALALCHCATAFSVASWDLRRSTPPIARASSAPGPTGTTSAARCTRGSSRASGR
jgi:hypothetical protein